MVIASAIAIFAHLLIVALKRRYSCFGTRMRLPDPREKLTYVHDIASRRAHKFYIVGAVMIKMVEVPLQSASVLKKWKGNCKFLVIVW